MKITVKYKPTKVEPPPKVPRIAKLMALAIHFDQLIREGKVRDQAEIAELGHVSRARVTQIMNLLNLAPDIQEELLFSIEKGGPTERCVRSLVALPNWKAQRKTNGLKTHALPVRT